ncbi:hypothetical protein DFJ74DRAFT_660548 [Hyaloraphidium curvatum]|nr:hypothetical protein DFJ74DRAFT_660548 [Hyaloraphidium curvatum]
MPGLPQGPGHWLPTLLRPRSSPELSTMRPRPGPQPLDQLPDLPPPPPPFLRSWRQAQSAATETTTPRRPSPGRRRLLGERAEAPQSRRRRRRPADLLFMTRARALCLLRVAPTTSPLPGSLGMDRSRGSPWPARGPPPRRARSTSRRCSSFCTSRPTLWLGTTPRAGLRSRCAPRIRCLISRSSSQTASAAVSLPSTSFPTTIGAGDFAPQRRWASAGSRPAAPSLPAGFASSPYSSPPSPSPSATACTR